MIVALPVFLQHSLHVQAMRIQQSNGTAYNSASSVVMTYPQSVFGEEILCTTIIGHHGWELSDPGLYSLNSETPPQ